MSFDNLIDTYTSGTPDVNGDYLFSFSTIPLIDTIAAQQQIAMQWVPTNVTNLNGNVVTALEGIDPDIAAMAAMVPDSALVIDENALTVTVDTSVLQASTFVGPDGDTYQRTELLAPTAAAPVLVMRSTPLDDRIVTFQAGSGISAGVLNLSAGQLFNALQELNAWRDYTDGTLFSIDLTGGGGGGITEAPEDGSKYARKDAGWAVVTDGADGADGAGLPVGGTTGQIIEKIDGTDYNTQWVNPPTGGSVVSIDDIGDVDTTTAAPTDGQVLTWNNANSEWEPQASAGGAVAINDLTDVIITSAATGEVLQYNGTDWVDIALSVTDLAVDGDQLPVIDNTYDLGSAAFRYNEIHGDLDGAVTLRCKNLTGGLTVVGQPVYISGHSGTVPEVSLADNNNPAALPAFGLCKEVVAANGELHIVTLGEMYGVDTSAFAIGDVLWVGDTPGSLTNVKPLTEAKELQNVGKVLTVHASNGAVIVNVTARTAATPNLDLDQFFLGDATGASVAVDFSDAVDTRIGITAPATHTHLEADITDLQAYALGTTVTEIDANANDLITLSGIAENVTTLGTFTGTTIADSSDIKAALQALETKAELSSATAINDLSDVDTVTSAPASGEVLTWNSTNSEWEPAAVPGGGGPTALDTLTDVTITAAATGEVLRYNGSAWVDASLVEADISDLGAYETTVDSDAYADGVKEILISSGASTGVVEGGVLTKGTTGTVNISAGHGHVIDTTTVPTAATITEATWTAFTNQAVTLLATTDETHLSINAAGTLIQRTTEPTAAQRRDEIQLGVLHHPDNVNIHVAHNSQHVSSNVAASMYDLMQAVGALNLTGNVFGPSGADLTIDKSAGTAFEAGTNWGNDTKTPHVTTDAAITNAVFTYVLQDSTVHNSAATVIDPAIYDLAGVATAVPAGKWTMQHLFMTTEDNVVIQPGQGLYGSQAQAEAAISSVHENFVIEHYLDEVSLLRGWLIVSDDCTDLSDPLQATFFEAGKFGGTPAVAGKVVKDLISSGTSTGMSDGGVLSVGTPTSTFSVTAGHGHVADTTTDPDNATLDQVHWDAYLNQAVTLLATNHETYVSIDTAGAIVQRATRPTNAQHRTEIQLGVLFHEDNATVRHANNHTAVGMNPASQINDLMQAIGDMNLSGNVFSANGVNLNINKTIGTIFSSGSNWGTSHLDPHVVSEAALTAPAFEYILQDNTVVTLSTTAIDPGNYDLAGVLTVVPSNKWTVQHIYMTTTDDVIIQPGQGLYGTLAAAEAAIATEAFVQAPELEGNALFRCWLIVKGNATDLSDLGQAEFFSAGKFGEATTTAGGSLVTSLEGLDDVTITTPATNAVLSYDGAGWIDKAITESDITDLKAYALSTTVTEIDANANDLITLSGVAENATNLGTFTGTTIANTVTNKVALQSLETAVETKAATGHTHLEADITDLQAYALGTTVTEIDANANDLITLSGVAENATNLGTFTGTTIADLSTNKTALQSLETAVETKAATSHTHVAADVTDFSTAADARIALAVIDDISDVDTTTVAPTDGQVLTWDNAAGKWEPAAGGGGGTTTISAGTNLKLNTEIFIGQAPDGKKMYSWTQELVCTGASQPCWDETATGLAGVATEGVSGSILSYVLDSNSDKRVGEAGSGYFIVDKTNDGQWIITIGSAGTATIQMLYTKVADPIETTVTTDEWNVVDQQIAPTNVLKLDTEILIGQAPNGQQMYSYTQSLSGTQNGATAWDESASGVLGIATTVVTMYNQSATQNAVGRFTGDQGGNLFIREATGTGLFKFVASGATWEDPTFTAHYTKDSESAVTLVTATEFANVTLPIGGTTGQHLTKIDGTDGNVEWSTPSGGGGALATYMQADATQNVALDSTAGSNTFGFPTAFDAVTISKGTWTLIANVGWLAPTTGIYECTFTSLAKIDTTSIRSSIGGYFTIGGVQEGQQVSNYSRDDQGVMTVQSTRLISLTAGDIIGYKWGKSSSSSVNILAGSAQSWFSIKQID